MGILSFFTRDRPSLPRVDHPVLGPMEATLVNKDGSYFWETSGPLVTPKGSISVFLDGSINGPSEEQVALWNWIYENSERLARSAEPLLLDRLRDFSLEAHIGDLVWSAAGLSADGDRSGTWNLSFDLSAEGSDQDGAILTAYFENGLPIVVSFDD